MPVLVAFRTLTQINFSLELNEDQTIAEVKKLVATEKGDDYAPELQKLIYNGKILDDATKVADVGFDSSKFVVVMLTKKKAAETPVPVAEPAAASAPAPAPAPVVEAEPAAPAVPAVAAAEALSPEQEETVAAITGMGYDREQAVAALRAAFWNPDRAVEFLLNGIPDDVVDQEPALGLGLGADPPGENVEEEVNEDLNMLANMPQLAEIRSMIQQNPEMLAAVLQQLAAVNPRLVQTIQNNQQAFMDILNGAGQNAPQGGGGAGAGAAAGERGPRRHVIHLSPEEAAAIERIKAIVNAPEAMVVEAYFACDKNEEAAINFIFSSLDEE
ncbi:CBN-RAD-23 protein [Caenorhabditis brenneri]|uniref:UV excision repair protein RAD23 n=1 Tax=Caenorhabditis brenneri TaxID=135651 RepID=G0MV44_CAEBE|nr:CBN-RAD-23 protein [Caenorhabditis brenneri]